jgi:NTF2 fold immunity protein of polymorphic toxin system component
VKFVAATALIATLTLSSAIAEPRRFSPAERAAIETARQYVTRHYPDFDIGNNPPIVREAAGTWEIEYELPKFMLGGTPVVVIEKDTFRVLRSYHTQ